MHAEEVADNESGGSLIVYKQVSSKSNCNNSNNIVSGDSISKGINAKNLKSRLYNADCRCRFFGNATSKHLYHYICPNLNEADVITDIAILHIGREMTFLNSRVTVIMIL